MFGTFGFLHVLVGATWDYGCFQRSTVMCAPTSNPMALAVGFGIPLGALFGLWFGIPYAMCCQLGSWPKRNEDKSLKPLLALAGLMTLLAIVAGFVAWTKGLPEPWRSAETDSGPFGEPHAKVATLAVAMGVAYYTFPLGGLYLCAWVLGRRSAAARANRAVGNA